MVLSASLTTTNMRAGGRILSNTLRVSDHTTSSQPQQKPVNKTPNLSKMKTAFFLTVLGLAASAAANPLVGKPKSTPRPQRCKTIRTRLTWYTKNDRACLCWCRSHCVPDCLQVCSQQLLLVNLRREPKLQQRLLQLAPQQLLQVLLQPMQDLLRWFNDGHLQRMELLVGLSVDGGEREDSWIVHTQLFPHKSSAIADLRGAIQLKHPSVAQCEEPKGKNFDCVRKKIGTGHFSFLLCAHRPKGRRAERFLETLPLWI